MENLRVIRELKGKVASVKLEQTQITMLKDTIVKQSNYTYLEEYDIEGRRLNGSDSSSEIPQIKNYKMEHKYNNQGQIIEEHYHMGDELSLPDYLVDDKETKKIFFNPAGSPIRSYCTKRDNQGRIIEVSTLDGIEKEMIYQKNITYLPDGNREEYTNHFKTINFGVVLNDAKGNSIEIHPYNSLAYKVLFDAKDNPCRFYSFGKKQEIITKYHFYYDQAGFLIRIKKYESDAIFLRSKWIKKLVSPILKFIPLQQDFYLYNNAGKKIEMKSYFLFRYSSKNCFSYDVNERLCLEQYYDSRNELHIENSFQYDALGNCINNVKKIYTMGNIDLMDSNEYEYDNHNNWTKRIWKQWIKSIGSNGPFDSEMITRRIIKYYY